MKKKRRRILGAVGRLIFIILILVSTFCYAMFQGGVVSWSIFYIIVPFSLYSILLFIYPLSDIAVKRTIRTRNIENGGKMVVSLMVKRKKRFPLLYTVLTEIWLEDELRLRAGADSKRIFIFGFRKELTWDYEVDKMPRGEHVFLGVDIEVSDFFGWLRKSKFIEEKSTVLVYPKITAVHYVPLDTQYDRGTVISPLNIVKDTTMATGVRDYQAGDRVSWIHWKSFARTQTLMTKEFEDKRSQELFLILDARNSSTFEENIELVASIMKEAVGYQSGLSFLTTGNEPKIIPNIQSEEQLNVALIHLAKIKPTMEDRVVVTGIYETEIRQGGSIVIITSRPDWPFMQAILSNARSGQSINCFCIVNKGNVISPKVEEGILEAKKHGVLVHKLAREEFVDAFNEVSRR